MNTIKTFITNYGIVIALSAIGLAMFLFGKPID